MEKLGYNGKDEKGLFNKDKGFRVYKNATIPEISSKSMDYIVKAEKKFKNLRSDKEDLENKIKKLQDDIQKNLKDQEDTQKDIENQRKSLEDLKFKRKSA